MGFVSEDDNRSSLSMIEGNDWVAAGKPLQSNIDAYPKLMVTIRNCPDCQESDVFLEVSRVVANQKREAKTEFIKNVLLEELGQFRDFTDAKR